MIVWKNRNRMEKCWIKAKDTWGLFAGIPLPRLVWEPTHEQRGLLGENIRGGASSSLPRKQTKTDFPLSVERCLLPHKELSTVLCLCFLVLPSSSLPLSLPRSPLCLGVNYSWLSRLQPPTQQPSRMPWAPWHKAVQLISQAWLCPLLQFEKLLEKQVSGNIGAHCFVLSVCSVSSMVLAVSFPAKIKMRLLFLMLYFQLAFEIRSGCSYRCHDDDHGGS